MTEISDKMNRERASKGKVREKKGISRWQKKKASCL